MPLAPQSASPTAIAMAVTMMVTAVRVALSSQAAAAPQKQILLLSVWGQDFFVFSFFILQVVCN